MIKAEWTNKDSLDLQQTCNKLATTEGDLISRADAVKTVIRKCSPICDWQVGTQKYPDCVVAEINALPSADAEWIPCSERLPCEKDGRVLVTKRGEVMTARYSEFSGTWYLGDMCAVGGENPIAWMPLPEPYREDGDA